MDGHGQKVIDLFLIFPFISTTKRRMDIMWLTFLLLMTSGRIWDMFQSNRSIFKFYPHITFDLGFHGQNGVWKIARHIYLKVWTFLRILICEFPNTNKMGTGFYFKTYRPALLGMQKELSGSGSPTDPSWYTPPPPSRIPGKILFCFAL